MPLPALEWPARLGRLVEGVRIEPASGSRGVCRIDVDVDAETLFQLNELEAHARHRKVRIPLADGSGCLNGEMNTIIGLGPASEPEGHIGRVRISFHDVVTDDCSDDLD